MRPSWLLVLVLVALLADSCAPSHSFNDFEKAGQTSGTAAAGRTADGLIVKFSSYAPASAHELTLDACMRTVNGSHLVIERRNPAANLPTDFLVVKFPPLDFDRLAGAIRVSSLIHTLRDVHYSIRLTEKRVRLVSHRGTHK